MQNQILIGCLISLFGLTTLANDSNLSQISHTEFHSAFFTPQDTNSQSTPKSILVYVDPLTNNLHVSLLHCIEKHIEITITNKAGKEMMHTRNTGGQEVTYDISSFPNGMYYIEIKTPKNAFTYKVSL